MSFYVFVKKLVASATIPQYASEKQWGANIFASESVNIPAGAVRSVSLGIGIKCNKRCDIQIRPLFSLAQSGVTLFCSPISVPQDFRGESRILLQNHNTSQFRINAGDPVAQIFALLQGTPEIIEFNEVCGTIEDTNAALIKAEFLDIDTLTEEQKEMFRYGHNDL